MWYRLGTLASSIGLVLRLVATAVLLTVAVERGLQHAGLIGMDDHSMLGLIALLIGGIGDDWPALVKWCMRLWASRRAGDGGAR